MGHKRYSFSCFFAIFALRADAAGTTTYVDSNLGLSFSRNANFLNPAESSKKFWSDLCGKIDHASCVKSTPVLLKEKLKKECASLKGCSLQQTPEQEAQLDKAVSYQIELAGEKDATSDNSQTFRDTVNASGTFSYSDRWNQNQVTLMLKNKTSFYKKNKNGISFYWSDDKNLCAVKKSKVICFAVQAKDYVLPDLYDESPAKIKSNDIANEKKALAMLGPIISTLKFLK